MARRERFGDGWAGRIVLVTGGAGFIGSHLVHRLRSSGSRVRVFDAFLEGSGANRANLDESEGAAVPESSGTVELLEGDLRDGEAVASALAGVRTVFHLAGAGGHRESMRDPLADFEANVVATAGLLAGCAASAPHPEILFASTRQVYGRTPPRPVPESHPPDPPDANAAHKEAAEHLVRKYAAETGARVAILRIPNVYGPRQPLGDPRHGFAAAFLGRALAGEDVEILGDPNLERQILYVEDVVDALLLAGGPDAPAGVFNLGGSPVTLRAFAEAALRAAGSSRKVREAPLPDAMEAVAVGAAFVDDSRIRDALGWAPAVGLDEGLARTVASHRKRGRS